MDIPEKVPLRPSKYFLDHSNVRFAADPKLALRALLEVFALSWISSGHRVGSDASATLGVEELKKIFYQWTFLEYDKTCHVGGEHVW
jgi:hypothetical protein